MLQSSLRSKISVFVQRRLKAERRGGKRVTPARHTVCLLRQANVESGQTAFVHNLSFKGLALLSECDFPAGTLLNVLLINAAHTYSVQVEVRIVRSLRTGPHYLLAGPFEQSLRHEDVVPFLL